MSENSTTSAIPMALADDYQRWQQRENSRRQPEKPSDEVFADAKKQMIAAFAEAPEKVEIPYHLTPEGERLAKFRSVCDGQFGSKINRSLLKNPAAFDRVADWDGSFPGPLAYGATGAAKTRAAWSALGRLWVRENRAFAWFTVKRLVTEFERYESQGSADQFWRNYSPFRFRVLFVDDIDKLNWTYPSQIQALFSFYDWVYRARIACITTTNNDRTWWKEKMGDAFVRRLFDEAHFEVKF